MVSGKLKLTEPFIATSAKVEEVNGIPRLQIHPMRLPLFAAMTHQETCPTRGRRPLVIQGRLNALQPVPVISLVVVNAARQVRLPAVLTPALSVSIFGDSYLSHRKLLSGLGARWTRGYPSGRG